jgi:hypothetical protein
MTHDEFTAELDRLVGGFRHEMTETRAEAFWQALKRHPLPVWRAAVDRALLDPRFPTGDRLLKFVEEAMDSERQRSARAHRSDPILPSRISPKVDDPAYGQFRLDLLRDLVRDGLQPRQVAERLRGAWEIFPVHRARLEEEIASLSSATGWSSVKLTPLSPAEISEGP